MSGSIAAIAAYSGTGTQGHGTVDEQDQGVKSVFWNDYDTDKHFVNGCSVSEVTSNKGTITESETIVFTFDNDIDAISDLTMSFVDGKLSIEGPLEEQINPKYPNWMSFEMDGNRFTISAKANPYSPELCFFLMEVWKEVKMNPDKVLGRIIEESLFFIEKRWNFNKEPLDKKSQENMSETSS